MRRSGIYPIEYLQSDTALRKFKISAYLDVYAEVRGKAPCHHSVEGLAHLPNNRDRARKDFEKACATSVALSSLPWKTGKITLAK